MHCKRVNDIYFFIIIFYRPLNIFVSFFRFVSQNYSADNLVIIFCNVQGTLINPIFCVIFVWIYSLFPPRIIFVLAQIITYIVIELTNLFNISNIRFYNFYSILQTKYTSFQIYSNFPINFDFSLVPLYHNHFPEGMNFTKNSFFMIILFP